jgi:hypothetical protein
MAGEVAFVESCRRRREMRGGAQNGFAWEHRGMVADLQLPRFVEAFEADGFPLGFVQKRRGDLEAGHPY